MRSTSIHKRALHEQALSLATPVAKTQREPMKGLCSSAHWFVNIEFVWPPSPASP